MISRRDFVKGGVALVSIGTSASSLLKGAVAFAAQNPGYVAPDNGKTLVLVQLAGGNDGINTVVPEGNSAYYSARPTLRVAQGSTLALEPGYGLHPNLAGLKGLWDQGKLAVVQGVGYANQNYSHFKSMAIWQAGDPELRLQDGWLGRTLEAMESQQHDPFFGFNIGSSTPPEMRSPEVSITSISDPADYGFKVAGRAAPGTDARTATLMKLYEQYPASSPYGVLLETTAESAVESAAAMAKASAAYTPAVTYPDTSFAAGLSVLAEAITGGLGMRVGHVSLGGFDTHSGQPDDHERLLQTLDQGLTAFQQDLEAHGKADDVLVLTWSEFGRRVQQNANDGTDHGSASNMFVLGTGVRRGLYGEAPSLTNLIDKGNLNYSTDFRSVYATVIERWLGVPSEVLLGKRWEPLGFLPSL